MTYREDFIKRLIAQFFQVFHKMLGLIETTELDNAQDIIEDLREEFVGLSPHLIDTLSPEDLISMLTVAEDPALTKPLILSELLRAQGDLDEAKEEPDNAFQRRLKALQLKLMVAEMSESPDFPEPFTPVDRHADQLEEYLLPPETSAALFAYYESSGQYARAEEKLFDLIEDSPEPAEMVAAGLRFVERLRQKTAEQLAAGELTPSDIDDIQSELLESTDDPKGEQ